MKKRVIDTAAKTAMLFSLFLIAAGSLSAQPRIERIAFETNVAGGNSLEIYLMKPDGTALVRLTNNSAFDINPVISPDGKKIAFSSDRDGNYEIYVMNVDGTNPIRLTNNAAFDTDPAWNSDGTKILFTTSRDGNSEIYQMNADGSNQTNVSNDPVASDSHAQFNNDDTKIVYLSGQQVWIMDANGSNKMQLTNETAPLTVNPTFSPDGTKIAFRKIRDVHVMNLDGTNQVNLTNTGALDNEPSYSPDGSKIAFKSYRDGNFEIYSMNADGSNQKPLTKTTAVTNAEPDWGSIAGVGVDIPSLSAAPLSTITVPINVSDTNGWGILSYDFVLNYNSEVLEPELMPYDTSGTMSLNFEVNASGNSPGQLTISGFGTAPLSGAGTLLNLKFRVIGHPQARSSLSLGSIAFNEGTPFAIASPGDVRVTGVMRGTVRYATSVSLPAVPNVSLLGSGSPDVSTTTVDDGTYELLGFGTGSYTVTPSKQGDNNGITALDASLISKFLVGTTSLTPEQVLAGDVSNNGSLSSFDAALIAQYVAGISNTSQTGSWRFQPGSRAYTSVANESGQDYLAFLMGEVSGNWAHQSSALFGSDSNRIGSDDRRPASGVSASLPTIKAGANTVVNIPVSLSLPTSATPLDAYQFDLTFDPQVIRPDGFSAETQGTLSGGLNALVNHVAPGRLRVVVYGSNAITTGGTLINLKFLVVGTPGTASPLAFNGLLFNEGNPAVEGRNGKVTVRR